MKKNYKSAVVFLSAISFLVVANAETSGDMNAKLSSLIKDKFQVSAPVIKIKKSFVIPKETRLLSAVSETGEAVSCRLSVVDDLKNGLPMKYTYTPGAGTSGHVSSIKNMSYRDGAGVERVKSIVKIVFGNSQYLTKDFLIQTPLNLLINCDEMTLEDFKKVMSEMGEVSFVDLSEMGT